VEIESITHKALRKMFTTGVNKGVIEHRRVINMLQYIVDAGSFDELAIPQFRLPPLVTDRTVPPAVTRTGADLPG
jgi:proteic killer suppression protein